MLYDKYVAKIKNVAKAKGVILFFKFVFLAIFLLALLFSITFIANKGKLKNGIEMPSSINYGEDYEFACKTQFGGSVRYFEYREENSTEWMKEKPTLAGTYYVRAVTSKFVGSRKSSEFKFTINKKDLSIDVTSDKVNYGEYPTYTVTGLKSNDNVNSLTFTYDSFNKTMTNVSISNVIVTDVNGTDVTNCYNITTNGKEIGFNKRNILINPTMDSEYVYSGEEVTYNNTFTITNSLGYSDIAIVEGKIYDLDGNETNAILPGKYVVKVTSYTLKNSKEDVSANYNVETNTFSFDILKRDIIIKTNSKTKVYDGEKLSGEINEYQISENSKYDLLSNHRLVNKTDTFQSITYYNNDGISNTMDIRVFDSDDNDITNTLYNISYDYGKLFIEKRDITIKTTTDDTFIYDGITTYSRSDISDISVYSGSLALSDEIYLRSGTQPSISTPGRKINNINYSIRDILTQEDISNSYNINRLDGELIMYSKEITIKSKNVSCVYGDNYKLEENKYFKFYNTYTGFEDDIRDNTTIEVEYYQNNIKVEPKNVGEYQIRIKSVNTIDKYDINVYDLEFGVLTISPKPIDIKLKDDFATNYVYNGKEVSYYDDYNNFYLINNSSLENNDKLKVTVDYYDSSDNKLTTAPKDFGTYYIKYVTYVTYVDEFNNNEFNNNTNYSISTVDPLYFNITKRNVSIVINNLNSKVYDKNVYDYNNASYSITGLVDGESITPNFACDVVSPTNAGTYTLSIASVNYLDGAKEENYNVDYTSISTFTINPIELEITFKDIQNDGEEYDGSELLTYSNSQSNFNIVKGYILTGDSIKINYNFYVKGENTPTTPKNANTYEIRYLDYEVLGTEKSNYIIVSCPNKECKINKRVVKVAPKDMNKIYDGQSISYDGSFVYKSDNKFIEDDYIGSTYSFGIGINYYDSNYSLIDVTNVKNAGSYYMKANGYSTNIPNISQNYDIVYEGYSSLIIGKMTVNISMLDMDDCYYNGQIVKYSESYNNYSSDDILPNGEKIKINVKYQKKVNGVYVDLGENEYPIDAYEYRVLYNNSFESTNLTSNYNVILDENEAKCFTIKKIPLTISLNSQTSTYGDKFSYPTSDFNITGSLVMGESINVFANIYDGTTLINNNETNYLNVGYYNIRATINDIIFNGRSINNYDITIDLSNNPTLQITTRKVEIALIAPDEVIYDGEGHVYNIHNCHITNTYNNMANGDVITIDSVKYNENVELPIDAGSYSLSLLSYSITRNNNNYNSNYDVICSNDGLVNLTIKEREVTIKLLSQTITYGDQFNYPIYPNKQFDIYTDSLNFASGEKISLNVAIYKNNVLVNDLSRLNAGSYEIRSNISLITLEEGRSLSNYDIKVMFNTLTVNPKNITVNLYNLEALEDYVYNGNAQGYYSGLDNYASATGLEPSDRIEIKVYYYYFGTQNIVVDNNNLPTTPKNAGKYDVKYHSYVDENNNSSNYIITANEISYEIAKRQITITPDSITSFDYDGKVYDYSDHTSTISNSIAGEDVTPIYQAYYNDEPVDVKDALTYELRIVDFNYSNYFNPNNYKITTEKTNIKINPKALTITPTNRNVNYKNAEYIGESYEYSTSINNEKLWVSVLYIDDEELQNNPIYVGTYKIIINSVSDYNGAKVSNYDISYSYGSVEIKPLKIYIKTKHYSNMDNLVYNKQKYIYVDEFGNFEVIGGGNNFFNNDKYDFKITVRYFKLVGEDYIDITNDEVIDATTYKVSVASVISNNPNYDVIGVDYVSFEIAKYEIDVTWFNYCPTFEGYDDCYYYTFNNTDYDCSDYWYFDNCYYNIPFDDAEEDNDRIKLMIKPILTGDITENNTALNVGNYSICLHNSNSFEIMNDLDSNYTVKFDPIDFKIVPFKHEFTIRDDYELDYSGWRGVLPINSNLDNEYNVTLSTGETLEFYFDFRQNNISKFPINAGEYDIVYSYFNISGNTPEIINYEITATPGLLKINKIDLDVYASSSKDELTDINFEYTGKAIDESIEKSIIKIYSEGLALPDYINDYSIQYYDSNKVQLSSKPKDIGLYYVKISNINIHTDNNPYISLNSNYNDNYYFTKLYITSGDVTIELKDVITSKTYGESMSNTFELNSTNSKITSNKFNYLSNSKYVFSVTLKYNDEFSRTDLGEYFHVGTYDITIDKLYINGVEIFAGNQLFTNISLKENTKLTIKPKPVTVKAIINEDNANDFTKVYDGTYFDKSGTYLNRYYVYDDQNKKVFDYSDQTHSLLPNGDIITATTYYNTNPFKIINAGTYYVRVNNITNPDYSFTYAETKIAISKAKVSVTMGKEKVIDDKTYDGLEIQDLVDLVTTNYSVKINGSSSFIINDETLQEEVISLSILVRYESGNYTSLNNVTAKNAGLYEFKIDSINEDYGNYVLDINVDELISSIKINKKAVSITTGGDTWEYDGYYHTSNELIAVGLVLDHNASINPYASLTSIINVGTIDNDININNIIIKDDDNVNQTVNYDITLSYGKLEITPREIYIKTSSTTLTYKGSSYDFNEYVAKYNGETYYDDSWVANCDSLSITQETENIKDVGEYDNKLSFVIESASSDNYIITFDDELGTIKIIPKVIECTFDHYELKEFDNQKYIFTKDIFDSQINDDHIQITFIDEDDNTFDAFKDAKEYNVWIKNINVLDENNNSRNNNYDFTNIINMECYFIISPKKIEVMPDGNSKYYDGNPLTCKSRINYKNSDDEKDLYNWGYTVSVDDTQLPEQTEIGSIFNELIYIVTNNNNIVTENCVFVNIEGGKENGYLTVNRIILELGNVNLSYNGQTLDSEEINKNINSNIDLNNQGLEIEINNYFILHLENDEFVLRDSITELGEYRVAFRDGDYSIYWNERDIAYTFIPEGNINNIGYDYYNGLPYYYATININKIKLDISVKKNRVKKTYDGEELRLSSDFINIDGVPLENHTVSANWSDYLEGDVDSKDVTATILIKDNYDNDVSMYYDYTFDKNIVTLTINPRTIEYGTESITNWFVYGSGEKIETVFDTKNFEVDYDETKKIYLLEKDGEKGLLNNHHLWITDFYLGTSLDYCDSIYNLLVYNHYVIYDGLGNDVTNNYKLKLKDGKLTLLASNRLTITYNSSKTMIESIEVYDLREQVLHIFDSLQSLNNLFLASYNLYAKTEEANDKISVKFCLDDDIEVKKSDLKKTYGIELN